MADDNILRVGTEFDVGPLVAGATAAGASVDSLRVKFTAIAKEAEGAGQTMIAQAARFQAQGLSADQAASALQNLGASEEEAATAAASAASAAGTDAVALEAVSVAATGTATATRSMVSAMGAARVEMGALEGSAGMMAGGLARVAAQSSTLAPIIQAAFVPFAIAAFVDIAIQAAEKIYHVYENVILLKAAIESLSKADETEAQKAASLNYEYENGLARRLEGEGKLAAARAEYAKANADKPLELPKIDDKNFKQFQSDFVSFMQSVHTQSEAPTVISRIGEELKSTEQQLDIAKAGLTAFSGIGLDNAKAHVEDLALKLAFLRGAIGEVQSQSGVSANAIAADFDSIAKHATEDADKAARAQEKSARETAEAIKKTQEDIAKARIPEFGLAPDEAIFRDTMLKMGEEAIQAADTIRNAFITSDTDIELAFEKDIKERGKLWGEEAKKESDIAKKSADEMQKAITTATKKMETEFNSNFAQIITGQKTLAQGFIDIWNRAAELFIQNILKMVEQMIVAYATQSALQKTSILKTAGHAAAEAFDAMAGIPIIGPELGAVAAAATFAAVVAFGSFEQGGIVPSTGMHYLHENEMVLPKNISGPLQTLMPAIQNFNSTVNAGSPNMAGGGSSVTNNNRGATYNNTTINHQGTSMKHADIIRAVSKGVRRGELRI